jgi:hypothetical protein
MRTRSLLSFIAFLQLVHISLPLKSPAVSRINKQHKFAQTCTSLELRTGEGSDGGDGGGTGSKRRTISTDDIDSLFAGASSRTKNMLSSDDDVDDAAYGYDYDYDDDVDENAGSSSSAVGGNSKSNSNSNNDSSIKNNKESDTRIVAGDADRVYRATEVKEDPPRMKGKYKVDSSLLDLVDLENAYHASRTAAPLPPSAGDVFTDEMQPVVRTVISSEFDYETGLEYVNLDQVLDRRQRTNMLDSISITDKVSTQANHTYHQIFVRLRCCNKIFFD